MAKKKARMKKRRGTGGGRPRVRTGDEVQVTVEFPYDDYARFAAYVEFAKEKAAMQGDSVSKQSQRYLVLGWWRAFWDEQTYETKRLVEKGEYYQALMENRPRV